MAKNYLPNQYKKDNILSISHSYLPKQFKNSKHIIKDIKKLIIRGDYTLGETVNELENDLKNITKTKYVISVGSGTDAISLSLKALGIKENDEVITTAYTFYATVGAIVSLGAKPVFVDIKSDYNIDESKIESLITKKTKAIVPVHWAGLLCNMKMISQIAKKYNLKIVEDACHAINAHYNNYRAGFYGDAACFSMHPLKNLNVWGDGGFVATNSAKLYNKLILLRNHGLTNRDTCEIFAGNSRLDTIQAIVAKHLLKRINLITNKRINNAKFYDKSLSKIKQIEVPLRYEKDKQVFHIYVIKAKKRNSLQKFLINNGIDAKIHYPIPMHLQPAAKNLGYKKGDLPNTELTCKNILSLPVHEYISKKDREHVALTIKKFFKNIK